MKESGALVFVVDDDASMRRSTARLLRAEGYQSEVFATAGEFLERAVCGEPSCLILDVQLPDLNGIKLQEALTAAGRVLPIIFITGHGDIPMSVRAMKAGAVDFLSKPFSSDALLKAVQQALSRSRSEQETRSEVDSVVQRLATLTPREHEVFCHVVTGKLNKQIAGDLGIAEKTVKVHRGRVMQKMQADSAAELVLLALKVGIPGSESSADPSASAEKPRPDRPKTRQFMDARRWEI